MINSYINERNNKLKRNKEKDNYIFGMVLGFILLLLNIYYFLSTEDIFINNIIYLFFIGIGVLLILMVTIYPNLVNGLHNLFKYLFNIIGRILIAVLLTIIYFVLVFPIGLIIKKKDNSVETNSNFTDYDGSIELVSNKKFTILKVFKIFCDEKYALMLPLIIILILFSLLFIFVQSSVVAPFIYTLF